MTTDNIHITGCMMVRNETLRLHVTLNSIKDTVKSLILYDTGSTDNTIEIARTFCETNGIVFRLIEGIFVDFCTSRNIVLDFADTFTDILYAKSGGLVSMTSTIMFDW
jgi:glycosyltransferase involved in cell wall biosynthesis